MLNCWYNDPHQRPRFATLVQSLSDVLEEEADYFSLSRSLSWKKKGKKPLSAVLPSELLTVEEGEKEEEKEEEEEEEEEEKEEEEEEEEEEEREGSTEENVALENLGYDDQENKEDTPPEETTSL